jgi:hypothetical protein
MSSKKTTPERLTTFSDGVFAVIITIMVLDLKPPAEATFEGTPPPVAHGPELCRQLSVHRNHLGEPSSPLQIYSRGYIPTDLVEFRTSLYGVVRAGGNGLDGCNAASGRSSFYLCPSLFPGGDSLHRFRTSGVLPGKRHGYQSSAEADCENSVLSGARHIQCRGRHLPLVSPDRARPGLLRTAHLPKPTRAQLIRLTAR